MERKFLKIGIILIVLLSLSNQKMFGQIEKFKAAYIFNFTRYVDWPSTYNTSEFVIGVLSKDVEIISELKKIVQSKTVVNKPIKIITYSLISEIGKCNILFVGKEFSAQMAEIIQKIKSNNVLIIGEKPGAIKEGVAINFIINDNKLAFEIKPSNAEEKGLKVSNTLENLAYKKY